MKIGIDVDGVLADFNAAYIQRTIDITKHDFFPPRPFDILTWNYPESYGYTAKEVSAVWDSIKADPAFWFNLKPYFDAPTMLELLQQYRDAGHDVYFITARPGLNPKAQTERWLEVYGPFHGSTPTVLISSQKGLCCRALEIDAYIDDRIENVVETSQICQTYLLNRPWNAGLDAPWYGITRVSTIEDMLDHCGVDFGVTSRFNPAA